ncbi:Mcm21p LALA0_S05e01992g [Lachancea lanzarotensis]|uniref:LALA0S05e01992g1_1 n=1 Tax=Lachancea lanzarotensis TaxID=1245769 RepID=A0A0C7N2R3_9SACH|nr:uncharacterized protein LALA0_S05e01992g [Lachancea lanzarotensis]CEP62280.1 LALA0S05e01992g1_1 [Lachancea lanzarotensis]
MVDALDHQDIEALRSQISDLTAKLERLKNNENFQTLYAEQHASDFSQLPNDAIDEAPGSREEKSTFEGAHLLPDPAATRHKDVTSIERERSDTPHKKQELGFSAALGSQWLPNSREPTEHKLFDSDLEELISTNILNSPTKRTDEAQSLQKHQLGMDGLYRAFGISVFPVVDPSDLDRQEDGTVSIRRQMLGLRLEIYNELNAEFEPPYYVLFKQDSSASRWKLFKHTVPSYVGLEDLFERTGRCNPLSSLSEISTFGKKVYMALLYVSIKLQTLSRLEQEAKISNLQTDPACAMPSFQIPGVPTRFKLEIDSHDVVAYSCTPLVKQNWASILLGPLSALSERLNALVE